VVVVDFAGERVASFFFFAVVVGLSDLVV